MNDPKAHCVPMALMVMAACVSWLKDTFWLWDASVDIAMPQLPLRVANVARGRAALCRGVFFWEAPEGVFRSSSHQITRRFGGHTTFSPRTVGRWHELYQLRPCELRFFSSAPDGQHANGAQKSTMHSRNT